MGSVPGGVGSVYSGASAAGAEGQPGDDFSVATVDAGQPRLHGHAETAVEPHCWQLVPYTGSKKLISMTPEKNETDLF